MSQGVVFSGAEKGAAKAPILEMFEYVEVPWTAAAGGTDFQGLGIRDAGDRRGAGGSEGSHAGYDSQRSAGKHTAWEESQRGGMEREHEEERSTYQGAEGCVSAVSGTVSQGEGGNTEILVRLLAEERSKGEEGGFERGLEEGFRRSQEQTHELSLQALNAEKLRLRKQAAEMVEGFAASQSSYFHQVEQETVRLALAVAARILRRESQSDPLLLTGSVRAALGQLQQATTVRIRVPAQDGELWRESVNLIPRLAVRPEVIGDEQLSGGEARIETELGSANLGLWSQLTEIEKIFFDRHPDVSGTARVAARTSSAA